MERLKIGQWTLEIGVEVGSYRLTKSGVIWTELRPVSGIAIFDSSVAIMQQRLLKIGDGANYSLLLPDAIKNEGATYSLVLRRTNMTTTPWLAIGSHTTIMTTTPWLLPDPITGRQ